VLKRPSLVLLKCAFCLGFLLAASDFHLRAQSLDDLNIQIHGYATQGFLYTTQNNMLTTQSSDGSPSWTEAVVNVGAQPMPKLRIGVQGRYQLLGNYVNGISLDWAAADYKVNDRFGFRFGKVKTPMGLLNETQDIDPSYMWSLLPQGIYQISSRNSQLSHYGGVIYGTLNLSQQLGKLEYRGWSGTTALSSNDGYLIAFKEAGIEMPNGISGVNNGAALRWRTPLPGLMIGASFKRLNKQSSIATTANGALTGSFNVPAFSQPDFFARYEKDKVMVAGEYLRTAIPGANFQFPGLPTLYDPYDTRALYGMGSYKLTEKLNTGLYYSQIFQRPAPLGPGRYQKDWAIAGRYDFNQFLYAKVEQHFIDGTYSSYDTLLNPKGLKPDTRLTVLKIGVSF
jgi:hypothetical protein